MIEDYVNHQLVEMSIGCAAAFLLIVATCISLAMKKMKRSFMERNKGAGKDES